jgi:hypothetical protein
MSEEDESPEEDYEDRQEEFHWDEGENFDERTEWVGDHYNRKGCCLNCADKHKGCLCYNCRCSRCDWQNSYNGSCRKVGEFKEKREEEMASHIEIVFKPFLQTHFRWSSEMCCWWQYSENWRFVRWLRGTLFDCNFCPVEKIEEYNGIDTT